MDSAGAVKQPVPVRTKTSDINRGLGQTVIVGDVVVQVLGIRGLTVRLRITRPDGVYIEANLDADYLRENFDLAKNEYHYTVLKPKVKQEAS